MKGQIQLTWVRKIGGREKESFVQNILPKPFYGPYLALLEQVGLGREAYWLEERGSWRA